MASLWPLQSAIGEPGLGNLHHGSSGRWSDVRLRQQEEGYILDPLNDAANRPGRDTGSPKTGDRALRRFASQCGFDLGALCRAVESPDYVVSAVRRSLRSQPKWLQPHVLIVEDKLPPALVRPVQKHGTEESVWLAEAMVELEEIDSFIETEGLPPIGEYARLEASRILKELSPQPVAAVVYPAEGEIVIQFTAPKAPEMITIDVNNNGQGTCFAHIRNTNRRRRYASSSSIPDDFVREQLRELSLAE